MNNKYSLTQIIAITASFAVLAGFFIFISLIAPVSFDEKWIEVEIPEGATYTQGINILKENGIIKSKLTFLLLGRLTATHRQLKAGYYYLSASQNPLEIFQNLIEGRTVQYSIVITEGLNLENIKKKFDKTDLMDDESWQLVYDKDFLDYLEIDAPSLEGYLYPDTYNFPKGTDPELIFKIMVRRMREHFDDSLRERAEDMGMTENEVLTLASIIEREAIFDSERPLISAVYHNRLKKNMRLQADPTVLYGVKNRWKRIRYRDLRRVTPYNTYKIKGLPPGPIASPGIKSIKAALFPADADYFYFVSMNNGRHFFSSTNEEHAKAVDLYQRNGYNKAINGENKIN